MKNILPLTIIATALTAGAAQAQTGVLSGITLTQSATQAKSGLTSSEVAATLNYTGTGGTTYGPSTLSHPSTLSGTSGVQHVSVKPSLQLFPNPNKGIFTVKGTTGTTDDATVELTVTDMLGQTVYSSTVTAQDGMLNHQLQLSQNIANGAYILSVRTGKDQSIFHIVVER